mmetsp:Transcript_22916/g.45794  ORF Transcript_22916/g.45794 Transcript_22916/m.45794 type:complete len:1492 (+) Transcript_22916:238-4713(+)
MPPYLQQKTRRTSTKMSDEDWDPNQGFFSDSSVASRVISRDKNVKIQPDESNDEMEYTRDQKHSPRAAAKTAPSSANNNEDNFFSGNDEDDGVYHSAQVKSNEFSYDNFFTYPESPQEYENHLTDDSHYNPLRSFYDEALITKRPIASESQSQQSQFLSQTSNISQQTSISLAEMSRLEESFLSQTSYRDEEDERQRQKMKGKRSYGKLGILGRKPPRIQTLTEAQKKRAKDVARMKFSKRVDVSEEQDVGGAMEYLLRKKFETKEEQRRLMQVARGRLDDEKRREKEEQQRREAQLWEHLEENMASSSSSSSSMSSQGSLPRKKQKRAKSNDETKSLDEKKTDGKLNNKPGNSLNWKFQEEGYVVMKSTDAHQLPFYLYQGSTRKMKGATKYFTGEGLDEDEEEIGEDEDHTDRLKFQSVQILLDIEDGSSSVESKPKAETKHHCPNQRSFPSDYAFSIDEPDHITHSFPLHFYQQKNFSELRANINMRAEGPDRLMFLHGRHAKRLWTRLVAGGVDGEYFCEVIDKNAKLEGDESISNVSSKSSSSSSKSPGHAAILHGKSRFQANHSSLTPFEVTSAVDTIINESGDADQSNDKPTNQVFRLMSLIHLLPKVFHRNRYLFKIAQELGTSRYLWENELKQWIEMRNDSYPETSRLKNFLTSDQKWALKSLMGVLGDIHSGLCWGSDPSAQTHPHLIKRRVMDFRKIILPRLRRLIRLEQKVIMERKLNSGVAGVVAETESMNVDAKYAEQTNALPAPLVDFLESDPFPEGEDRYAKVMHNTHIDLSNIPVTMSSLLDKLSFFITKLEKLKNSKDQNRRLEIHRVKENIYKWHESILIYLDFAEGQARPHGTALLNVDGKAPQSAPLTQSILASQSYLANGGSVGRGSKKKLKTSSHHRTKQEAVDIDDDEDDWDSDLDDEWVKNSSQLESEVHFNSKEWSYIQLSAKGIASRGMDHFKCENLHIFSPVHLITGVAIIANSVTPQAAEIISRPSGRGCPENPTPFELFSDMLVCLEESNNLVPNPLDTAAIWNSRGKVIDATFLDVLENASTIFKKCVQKEPHNVDNWSWYLATRLGIHCISSGLPLSECSNDEYRCKSTSKGLVTNCRSQVGNFYVKVNNSARAMLDFIDFAQCAGCAMFHLNIASMLEWRVAMSYFLQGRSNDKFLLELRQLHAFQVHRWAIKLGSISSMARVKHLYESNEIPRDSFLHVLVSTIERRPGDREIWMHLINVLGAVSHEKTINIKNYQDVEKSILGSWWDRIRATRWEEDFFYAPKSASTPVKPKFVHIVLDAIATLQWPTKHALRAKRKREKLYTLSDKVAMFEEANQCCTNWISHWTDEDLLTESEVEHFKVDFNSLPRKHNSKVFGTNYNDHINHSLREIQDRLSISPSCEAMCFKIVAACHLIGVHHNFVLDSVWWLSVKLWQSQTRKQKQPTEIAKDALYWLTLRGLDIPKILRIKLEQCSLHNLNRKQSNYFPLRNETTPVQH